MPGSKLAFLFIINSPHLLNSDFADENKFEWYSNLHDLTIL